MFRVVGPWLTGVNETKTTILGWLAFGFVLAIAGMFGDLAESLLKREGGVKDSGNGYLPGLGGVLDLVDSLLFAAPLAYLFWSVGVVAV
jgi:phosphatidate cytidylyltransferase